MKVVLLLLIFIHKITKNNHALDIDIHKYSTDNKTLEHLNQNVQKQLHLFCKYNTLG